MRASWLLFGVLITNSCLSYPVLTTNMMAYDSTAGYFIQKTPEGYVIKQSSPQSGNEHDRINQTPKTFYGQPNAY